MANPIKTFLNALIGIDSSEISDEEIKKAEQAGNIVAEKVKDRLKIVEQVDADAEAARKAAKVKAEKQIVEEKDKEEK